MEDYRCHKLLLELELGRKSGFNIPTTLDQSTIFGSVFISLNNGTIIDHVISIRYCWVYISKPTMEGNCDWFHPPSVIMPVEMVIDRTTNQPINHWWLLSSFLSLFRTTPLFISNCYHQSRCSVVVVVVIIIISSSRHFACSSSSSSSSSWSSSSSSSSSSSCMA